MQDDRWSGRRYGLDWLRIGAFGLLILYHIGMYFVTWDWHVKSAQPLPWLELPMLAINPWRLSLLFLISGVASRAMLARAKGRIGFLRERSARLLIPLLFGMALIVVPQPWAELQEKAGYRHGLGYFWLHDYFLFGKRSGLALPTWNHLWFLPYLWLYSSVLGLAAYLPATVRAWLQSLFERLFGGWRLVLLPCLWAWTVQMLVLPSYPATHGFFDDPYSHAIYAFAFAFGAGLARSNPSWATLEHHWIATLLLGSGAYLVFAGGYVLAPDNALPPAVRELTRSVEAWGIILGALGMAQRHLHRDSPARRYLTEAVFPYYIAHQTIIVLVGFWLRPLGLGPAREFAIILSATVFGCAATYEIARRVRWLRRPLGLKPLPKQEAMPQSSRRAPSG